jgi:tetratricopeptide (TPR) repeat protein
MLKINACIIVKDDSEYDKLACALETIAKFVDGIYLTTTGKETEKIKSIEEVYGNSIHHSHFDWVDDFAAARNFNFSQVPKDTDYIFWMDSDDLLVGGPKLREVAQMAKDGGKDVVFFTYWYGCEFDGEPSIQNFKGVLMEHNRERLIKPGVIQWRGRLHETPVPISGAKDNYTKYLYHETERPVAVMHTSKDEELPEKMERNQKLLELQLAEERERKEGADPRTLLYLMKIYAEKDEPKLWELCIPMGEEYLQKSGWDEERGTCWEQLGIVYGKKGNHKKAAECFHNAIDEWEIQPLFYIRLAYSYYNIGNYRKAEHWLTIAASMDLDNKGSNLTNFKAMKVLFATLLLKLNYNAHRNTTKALEAAKLLFSEDPRQENAQQVQFLEDLNQLNDACQNADMLLRYLDAIGADDKIVPILDSLPDAITSQPFAQKTRQMFTPPRKWGEKEICYFANFGQKHFEPWSPQSLESGIGGSETAVISLAREWAKQGYKVTIYGDPGEAKGEHDGVTYLPWYYFNPRDSFNVFIQWRGWQLAGKVKAKKFLVDLHDIYSAVDLDEEQLRNIDKIMVKSTYQRGLAPTIPLEKFEVISNGI